METYFDDIPDDILVVILLKITDVMTLLDISKLHRFDIILNSKSFWRLKHRQEFPLLRYDVGISAPFRFLMTDDKPSLQNILNMYRKLMKSYKGVYEDIIHLTVEPWPSRNVVIFDIDSIDDLDSLYLSSSQRDEVLSRKLLHGSFPRGTLYVRLALEGTYFISIEYPFVKLIVLDVTMSDIVTLVTHKNYHRM